MYCLSLCQPDTCHICSHFCEARTFNLANIACNYNCNIHAKYYYLSKV